MKKLTIISPGTTVQIARGEVKAQVNQICITSNFGVQYEVCWWAGNDRKLAWVEEHELQEFSGKQIDDRIQIGFK